MSENKKHYSLAHILTLCFVVFGLSPLIFGSWLAYKEADRSLRESANEELRLISELSGRFLQTWFNDRLKDLDGQAQSKNNATLLKTLRKGYEGSSHTLEKYVNSEKWQDLLTDANEDLVALNHRYDYFYDMFLIDHEGNILYSVAKENDLGTNIITGPFAGTQFAQSVRTTLETKQPSFSGLEFYSPSARSAGFISAPIFDSTGTNLGIFTIQLKVDALLDLFNFSAPTMSTTLNYYLVDQQGLLLSPMKGGNPYDPLKRIINTEPIKRLEKVERESVADYNWNNSTTEYIGPEGRSVLGISYIVEWAGVTWALIGEIDRDEALMSSDWLKKVLQSMLIFSIITLVILAVYLAKRITKPLITLADASFLAAAGHVDQKVEVHSNDEIGQLTMAFNYLLQSRKDYEEVLVERTSLAQQALSDLNDQKFALDQHAMVSITDIEGTIIFLNEKFIDSSGYQKGELVGRNHRILNSGYHSKSFFQEMYETIYSGEVWHGEICNRSKQGQLLWQNTTIVPLFGVVGKATTFIAISSDITSRKETESELLIAKTEAEQAVLAKNEFLASMSHEIRTPMNGVLGMLGLLLTESLSNVQHHQAILAYRSAQSLLGLIDDILDLSKVEAGMLDLEAIDFDLRAMISELVEAMAVQAHSKGLEVILDLSRIDQTMVKGDPNRMRQILTNLISNAIKFTHEGEIVIQFALVEKSEEIWSLEARVSDTGIGIPEEKISLLFQSFQQVDTSTTREYGGTGLGLAIVKKLCQLMNGDVRVESELDKGSSFIIEVEIAKSEEAVDVQPPADTEQCRLLIVDTNTSNREMLCQQLNAWEVSVRATTSGEQALQFCEEQQKKNALFDLILINIQLKDMSAWELAEKLQSNENFAQIKRVMMAANAVLDSQAQDDENFSDFFPKPVTPISLADLLSLRNSDKKYISKRRQAENTWLKLVDLEWQKEVNILLVEDNHVNQVVALGIINQFGLHADMVSNGLQAIEHLIKSDIHYDLILMDCEMPKMDGHEASREIRSGGAGKQYQQIPIIAMTANVMLGIRDKCRASGMNDYLAKPIDPKVLLAKLNEWAFHNEPSIPELKEVNTEQITDESQPLQSWNKEMVLRRVMGDTDLLSHVLDAFVDELPQRLEEIKQAIWSEDFEQIQLLSHSLKGIASSISAPILEQLATKLEQNTLTDQEKLLAEYAHLELISQQLLEEISLIRNETNLES